MKKTIYQRPEIRDEHDNIIQTGTYGKESPLVNSTNDGVLDYINNNLEALHDNINGARIYVANKAALPATGDLSAMYIAEDTGKWYLWDGTKYIETDNARKIADEAIAARDAAKASQTAAKTSENNAKTSENDAAASKSAAATSASAAKRARTTPGHRPTRLKRGQRQRPLPMVRRIHPVPQARHRAQRAGPCTARTGQRLLRPLQQRRQRRPRRQKRAKRTPLVAKVRRPPVRPMRPTVQGNSKQTGP